MSLAKLNMLKIQRDLYEILQIPDMRERFKQVEQWWNASIGEVHGSVMISTRALRESNLDAMKWNSESTAARVGVELLKSGVLRLEEVIPEPWEHQDPLHNYRSEFRMTAFVLRGPR